MCDPVSATIAATTAYTANQSRKAGKSAAASAAQEAALQREAEQNRVAQERAFAEQSLGETRGFQTEQLSLQRQMQAQAEAAAGAQLQAQQAAFARAEAAAQAEADRIRAAEEARQRNIAQGQQEISSAFGQFNDDFYNTRAKSFTDYALPQLDTQYQDTMRGLTAALARSGNLNSSLRGETFSKAQREYDAQKLALADRGLQYANDARSSIERARSELIGTNATLADPGAIRTLAEQRAQASAGTPAYSPITAMLTDLAASIGPGAKKSSTAQTAGGVGLFTDSLSGTAGRLVS